MAIGEYHGGEVSEKTLSMPELNRFSYFSDLRLGFSDDTYRLDVGLAD